MVQINDTDIDSANSLSEKIGGLEAHLASSHDENAFNPSTLPCMVDFFDFMNVIAVTEGVAEIPLLQNAVGGG